MMDSETICSVGSNSSGSGPPSLQNEFDNIQTSEKSAETEKLQQTNQATSPQNEVTSPVAPTTPGTGNYNTWPIAEFVKSVHLF
jgi:c-Jun-amino-terminal kinase-interacting protein 4